MLENRHITFFDEYYTYKDYALVNEYYEDDDCRKNTWMWCKVDEDQKVTEVKYLKGLSSNSYARFEEAYNLFKTTVDSI